MLLGYDQIKFDTFCFFSKLLKKKKTYLKYVQII